MRLVLKSIYLIVFLGSIFIISSKFANPPEPTKYLSLIGGYLIAVTSIIILNKSKTNILFSSTDLLIVIVTGIEMKHIFFGNLSHIHLLSFFALGILYIYTKGLKLNVNLAVYSLTLIAILQSVFGIGQYFHLWSNIAAPSYRITGSFDNPAGFAATLTAYFPFALYAVQKKQWYFKLLGSVSILAIIIGVALSQSRAGIVALGIITALWIFTLLPLKWKQLCKQKIVIASISLVAFLLIGGLYYWKKDSADGRLLIWQCAGQMIAYKPIFGHGIGGFQREYMTYQADYFRNHPDSPYAQLADIVKHPFNEYLLLWVEQGLVGILLWGTIGWLLIHTYIRSKNKKENRPFMLCLLGIAVFSCFSYPLNYPFIRLILVFSAAMIMKDEPHSIQIPTLISRIIRPILVIFILGAMGLTTKMFYNEYYWNKIAQRSLAGETRIVMPEYARLYPWMRGDGLFLYNYAAELNYIGEWKKSNELMSECSQLYNDNDVQLILADNCEQLKQYKLAEKHLLLAYQMIPNRFIPLYRLVLLYDKMGEHGKAVNLAHLILKKPVKIPSYEISQIKTEMKNFK